MSRRLALVVLLMVSTISIAPVQMAAAQSATTIRWDQVGHVADGSIKWIAAPPEGLSAALLLIGTSNGTRVSRDGGRSWSAEPDPPGTPIVAPGSGAAFSLGTNGLYRSTDGGASWSLVLPIGGLDPSVSSLGAGVPATQLLFSPAFQHDGMMFARVAGKAWRSPDSGTTWTSLDPGPGQPISVMRLSPTFASDRTIFAGAVTEPARSGSISRSPTANADSLGLLVSRDAGTTWSSLAALAIEGVPYQQVMDLAVSPAFAQDNTLIAVALGPPTAPEIQRPPVVPAAVFESRDAGASWMAVLQPPPSVQVGDQLVVSPSFLTDQTILLTGDRGGISPASGNCFVELSTDGGGSWNTPTYFQQYRPYSGCLGLAAISFNGVTALLAGIGPTQDWERSLDGGQTWRPLFAPGTQGQIDYGSLVALPNVVLQGTRGGDLFQFAPLAPCAVQPALGFGSVWSAHPEVQEQGCPLGPEQSVTVQTRHITDPGGVTDHDLYWISDVSDVCAALYADGGVAQATAIDAPACTASGDSTRQGSLLRFPNGQYWLFVADPGSNGFVLATNLSTVQRL